DTPEVRSLSPSITEPFRQAAAPPVGFTRATESRIGGGAYFKDWGDSTTFRARGARMGIM
ncbi:MAG: hypothetical protein V3U86_02040, partial [Acidobacteriota bacterium]